MEFHLRMDKYMKEVIKLLNDINKQNDTIIKQLRSIDNGVAEANGYITEDGKNDWFNYDMAIDFETDKAKEFEEDGN